MYIFYSLDDHFIDNFAKIELFGRKVNLRVN